MRGDALESRADRGMRAYVTSSDDARPKREVYAPPVGGDLGVGLG